MGESEERSGAPPARPARHLAAIMFTDLVGYSAMAHRDEALAIELLELHRRWVRDILPRYGGREIETIGDAFLIEFAGALAAVECAVHLQERFAAYNDAAPHRRQMKLRIGIHLGDVEHRGDKVMGDGVNVASRIHALADPGGICVSEDIYRAARTRGIRFTSMGTPQLKNIATPIEIYRVHAGSGSGRAALLAGARRRIGAMPRWLLYTIVAITLIAVFGDDKEEVPKAVRAKASAQPAIAVLPFENLSAEPDSAFFTDGLHDTVIGHLSRVSGLKVISRTSVMSYRGKQKNLKRIGRELGADHILEGSVQRAGDRLRVVAQLIDTDTDTHVWSNEYNRNIKDVFEVQADIAQSVASAVHAELTPQEKAVITDAPKTDPQAYDLYLKAMQVERRVGATSEEIHEAIGLLERAMAIDPQYAPAYALMAHLNDSLYWSGYDPSDARRDKVAEFADAALRLDPGLADAHVARATAHYHGWRNYEAALTELEIARRLAPGDASVHFWLAPIYRRQNRWTDALASLERATTLDPLNSQYLSEYGGTLQMMRRYDEAGRVFERFAAAAPPNPMVPVVLAYQRIFAAGDLSGLEKAVAALPPDFNPNCQATGIRVNLALLQRRFADVLGASAECRERFLPGSGGIQVPMELFLAQVKWIVGGRKAPPEAATARDILQGMLTKRPDSAELHMALATTLTLLGERQRAIEAADRAVALMPLSRDALTGADLRRNAVDVYANAGAEERAIDELEQLMRIPNGGHAQQLRLDPILDPLRSNPRFKRLLDQYLPASG